MKKTLLVLMLLSVTCGKVSAKSQLITENSKLEVVESLRTMLINGYVYPEKGKEYGDNLANAFDKGNFDNFVTDDDFALGLHRFLQTINVDRHLGVYGPARSAKIMASFHFEGEPETVEDQTSGRVSFDAREHLKVNTHDNISIFVFDEFYGQVEFETHIIDQLNKLPTNQAIVFDLRANQGGSGKLARNIASCFLNHHTPLWTMETMEDGSIRETTHISQTKTACRNIVSNKLYILTSNETASAAELFSFVLKNRGRATLIGETTMGASHSVEFMSLAHRFGMMLPIGRTLDPVTKTNFEEVGVVPHILINPSLSEEEYLDVIRQITTKDKNIYLIKDLKLEGAWEVEVGNN